MVFTYVIRVHSFVVTVVVADVADDAFHQCDPSSSPGVHTGLGVTRSDR